MERQITDIEMAIKTLTEELSSTRKSVDELHDTVCNQKRRIDSLQKENRELKSRLAKYEKPGKDSGNSSTPPSKERMSDEVRRRTKTLRKPSGLKPGGQTGHAGSTLNKTFAVDKTVDADPKFCTHCGSPLEDSERVLDYVTQAVSIPELRPVIREIRHYKRICKHCGAVVRARAGRKRGGNSVIYDDTVKSLAVYLSMVQFLPYGRIAKLFMEVFGLRISQGSIANWIALARKNAQPAIAAIMREIRKSSIVGFDESCFYCNKKLDWAWIAQTVYFTVLFRGDGRGAKELEGRFGDSLERMVAVTDRHSAYFAINFLGHQVCLAHLLRDLQYLDELDGKQDWSRKVGELLRESIHERNQHPKERIDKKPWLERLDTLLKQYVDRLGDDFRRMRAGLRKCRDYLFNFLENPLVPPDNNASERGIRKLKIKMKNACTFRSEWGADAFLEIHSIVETAKKHGKSSYDVIRCLFHSTDKVVMASAE
jgi:transposase/uncharacterized coiled-coil protein SlyX